MGLKGGESGAFLQAFSGSFEYNPPPRQGRTGIQCMSKSTVLNSGPHKEIRFRIKSLAAHRSRPTS